MKAAIPTHVDALEMALHKDRDLPGTADRRRQTTLEFVRIEALRAMRRDGGAAAVNRSRVRRS